MGPPRPGGSNSGPLTNDVYSTSWASGKQNQYAYRAGTSVATPHLAATVVMLLDRGYTPQQAIDRILATVDPMSSGAAARRAGDGSTWLRPWGRQ